LPLFSEFSYPLSLHFEKTHDVQNYIIHDIA